VATTGVETDIRPFQVEIPQAELDELRRREPELFANELRAAFRSLR
jgi:hypothetical protein